MCDPAGSDTGRCCGGPSTEYRCASCEGVSDVPFGSSGPASCVKRPDECNELSAVWIRDGSCHTDDEYASTRFAGLLEVCGKCFESAAFPAAASEPAGAC